MLSVCTNDTHKLRNGLGGWIRTTGPSVPGRELWPLSYTQMKLVYYNTFELVNYF